MTNIQNKIEQQRKEYRNTLRERQKLKFQIRNQAASIIQNVFKNYRQRRIMLVMAEVKKIKSARKIQYFWLKYKKIRSARKILNEKRLQYHNECALIITEHIMLYILKLKAKEELKIRREYKRYLAQMTIALYCQCWYRMKLAQRRVFKIKRSKELFEADRIARLQGRIVRNPRTRQTFGGKRVSKYSLGNDLTQLKISPKNSPSSIGDSRLPQLDSDLKPIKSTGYGKHSTKYSSDSSSHQDDITNEDAKSNTNYTEIGELISPLNLSIRKLN